MKIAKGKHGYYVIDSTYGIQILFASKFQRNCINWCKKNDYTYKTGYTW